MKNSRIARWRGLFKDNTAAFDYIGDMNEPLNYRSAGLDLDSYEQTISRLPPLLRRTYSPRVIEWTNGFAGLFRLDDQVGLAVASDVPCR